MKIYQKCNRSRQTLLTHPNRSKVSRIVSFYLNKSPKIIEGTLCKGTIIDGLKILSIKRINSPFWLHGTQRTFNL